MERWREQLYQQEYLAHHGIMGQKWGKKMGPPYPLDGSNHSASEKKAGWRESLSEKRSEKKRQKANYKLYKKGKYAELEEAIKSQISKQDAKKLKAAYKKMKKNIYDFDNDWSNKKAEKLYDKSIDSAMAYREVQDDIVKKSLGKYGKKKSTVYYDVWTGNGNKYKKRKGKIKRPASTLAWQKIHWDEIMNSKL